MRLSHGSLQSTKTQGMVLERGSWPVSTCCIYQLFGGKIWKVSIVAINMYFIMSENIGIW